jgi:hypothetical protein
MDIKIENNKGSKNLKEFMLCIKFFPKLKSSEGSVLIETHRDNQYNNSIDENLIEFLKNNFFTI